MGGQHAAAGLTADATLEESLGAEARLADQIYRLGAGLCADGCQGYLHTGGDLMPDALAESAASRRLLDRLPHCQDSNRLPHGEFRASMGHHES